MNIEINKGKNERNPDSSEFSKELTNYISKSSSFSIDRFEGEFAICENKQTNEMVNIKRSLLPEDCNEGDIIEFRDGIYVLNKTQTQKEQAEIKDLVDSLFKKKN